METLFKQAVCTDTPINVALNIKSGEPYLVSGNTQSVNVLMPNHKSWNALSKLR